MVGDYYAEKLSAERLRRCYEIASPRIRQYLRAEITHVLNCFRPGDTVLETGCGYGRAMAELLPRAGLLVGVDTSIASLLMARSFLGESRNYVLACMDASRLGFVDDAFDCVACVQNGISAFHTNPRRLIEEAIRVTRPGGKVLFSTYSERFWPDRLEWFRRQAEAGLLGEIDEERTGDGVIACRDGFTATTISPNEFERLTAGLDAEIILLEVDESSLFCELTPH